MQGVWPKKDERVHERVTGHEGTSQWTPLFVRTGETGKWHSKIKHYVTSCLSSGITLILYCQRNAKANAEKTYRNKLKKAGIQEQFVEENGEADEGASTSSRSEDDTDVNDHSRENDIHSGYAEWEFIASFLHTLCPVKLWIALVL